MHMPSPPSPRHAYPSVIRGQARSTFWKSLGSQHANPRWNEPHRVQPSIVVEMATVVAVALVVVAVVVVSAMVVAAVVVSAMVVAVVLLASVVVSFPDAVAARTWSITAKA